MGEDDEIEELLEKLAKKQLRVDYRKSLGSEHRRRFIDVEIERIFRKKDRFDKNSKKRNAAGGEEKVKGDSV